MSAINPLVDELRRRLVPMASGLQPAAGHEATYRELIGFVPPLAAPDSDTLDMRLRAMHDQMRRRALMPPQFDVKATHLLLLSMMLVEHGEAACAQGVAARRAGATWDELHAVVDLAFLAHGLPAANRGDELLAAIAEREHADRIAGAVAAYA